MIEVLMGWIIIILSIVIGLVAVSFIMIYTKSHRLRIRDPSSRYCYIKDFWMMEKKDRKTGAVWWIAVANKKLRIPEPPPDCIDVGRKGRKFVECYRLGEDEYSFIKDNGIDKKDKVVSTFRPFSLVERQVIVSQYAKAEELKQKNWIKENIVPATSILGLVIIVLMLVVFWGDIAKPSLESHALALQVQEQNIKIMQQLGLNNGGQLSQVPEPVQQGGITVPDENPPE